MKPSKYRNKKAEIGGKKFDSQKEARWYLHLKELERAGKIADLECQVRFKFDCGVSYIADFRFLDVKSGKTIVQDVKGFKTDVYKIKKKMMKNCKNIEIEEI